MAHHKSSDPNIFILPDLGEGVHEAELKEWRVKPGDRVEEHQTVAEMETDKALVEVPSPRAGVIAELFGNPGDILKVGEPAWTYQSENGAAPSPKPGAKAAPAGGGGKKPAAVSHIDAAQDDGGEREDAGTVVGTMSGSLGGVSSDGGKALATPAVRRLARDLGVDIDSVQGTGLAGRVTDRDVRAAAEGRGGGGGGGGQRAAQGRGTAPVATPAPARQLATTVLRHEVVDAPRTVLIPTGESTRIAIRGVRRTIALRLRESVDRAVHFSVMDEADVSALDEVRKRMQAASGEKVSYLPFVASAVCRALKEFPSLNAHVDDENQELVRHHVVHMGIATDTEHGLAVPVIPNCDALGLLEIGRHIAEIARMTRDRSVPRERLSGSTFTISNVGSYAGRFATPIINYPEVGILAAGRVRDGVVADRGAIRVAKLLPLSLTCDHRSVDGAEAARCLARIMELLGTPEVLLGPVRG